MVCTSTMTKGTRQTGSQRSRALLLACGAVALLLGLCAAPGEAAAPVLELAIEGAPEPTAAGATLTYSIAYANKGSAAARGVVLTLKNDARTTILYASRAADAGTQNRWTIGDLYAGASGSFTVTVRVGTAASNVHPGYQLYTQIDMSQTTGSSIFDYEMTAIGGQR
jgi:hypothetical protein